MSHFQQVKDALGNPELETIYKDAVALGWGTEEGVPINWFTSQAERPDIMKTTLTLIDEITMKGQLPPTVKQMIGMTIAMQNDCRYCVVAHSGALEAMGVPEGVIKSCATDPDLANVPPPQRAIIRFALKTSRNAQSVTDDDFEGLRDFGFSDGEIMEVIMTAACANFLNTWADVSGIKVDGED